VVLIAEGIPKRMITPSFAQESWWDWLAGSPVSLSLETIPVLLTFSRTSSSAVEKAFRTILASQEALLFYFKKSSSGLHASLRNPDEIKIRHVDISGQIASSNAAKRTAGIIQRHLKSALKRSSRQLVNAMIVSLPNESVIFCANFHHLVFDGISIGIFSRQMKTLLAPRPFSKGSPSEFSGRFLNQTAAERDWVKTSEGQGRIRYWEDWYKSVGAITPPANGNELACTAGLMIAYPFSLSVEVTSKMATVAHSFKVSDFALWLAIYATSLSRWSSCSHFPLRAIGNFRSSKELSGVIGLMLCYDPVKVDILPNEPLALTAKKLMKEYFDALRMRLPILPKNVSNNIPQSKIPIVINFMPSTASQKKTDDELARANGRGEWPSTNSICCHEKTPIPFSAIHLKTWYTGGMLCGRLELNADLISSSERTKLIDTFVDTLRSSLGV